MLALLSRFLLIRSLLGLGRHRRHRRGGYYGRRSRSGFYGPFPYHSRRTRGGSRVTVSGCCLPIPLGLLAATAMAARLLLRR
jgi:hypothetical protein